MATIAIQELKTTGTDLLLDQETYLNELTDNELEIAKGGGTPAVVASSIMATAGSVAASYGITKAGIAVGASIYKLITS